MPTTNISQILPDVIKHVHFSRKEQKRFVLGYSSALFLANYKNTLRLAKLSGSSQSSVSRFLNTDSISTRALSYSRVEYLSDFMVKNALTPKYIILDETTIKRRGNRIEHLGEFYSTTERRIVKGISLLSSMVWIKPKLYFPLFSSLRTKENLTKQFIELLKRIPFRNTILLMDGGILCSEIFFEAIKLGYTVIGRLNPVMDVVFNGVKLSLSSLRKQTRGTTSVEVIIPKYNNAKVKLVFHNTPQENRVILCSDSSMPEHEILGHYSKRNYIETYFKEVKQNFGLKPQVFSAKSTERHVELVQLAFTVWMLARFYRSVKDQIGLRDFLEKLRLNYYLCLAMRIIQTGYPVITRPFEFLVNSKCIT
ncbi:hypothetical protein AT15_06575 [Kosmotoga arenicorallina S304]|uniref:Transposase IS4-like domain-containing protein n=1 Tax=Kosmotoga arenicorallina S304 TaxID=1453497 RepID=A0A176JSQ6_9BACT|nr:transposase [Kosmotoga arenicorallina]OAA26158.1 hypothetical protein AT15_06575 [Kosmotoga arenicorallina S304]